MKAKDQRTGMELRLKFGKAEAGLIVHPGTSVGTHVSGKTTVHIEAPRIELRPDQEVEVIREGEEIPDELVPIQVRLIEDVATKGYDKRWEKGDDMSVGR